MNKRTVTKYISLIVVAGLITFYYCLSKEFLLQNRLQKYRILADGFTIPGILLTCFGLLLKISTTGALDGVSYGIQMAIKMLIPGAWSRKQEDFHDFVERRKEKRVSGFEFILHVGIVFIGIALVFTYLFSMLYDKQ